MSQPAQLSHLTTTGQVTDDLAAIPSKKRVRKVSTNTRISTSNDVAYDDGSVSDSAGVSRRRSVRKTSFSASGSYGPGSSQASQPSRSPHSFRTARPRTNSTTSSIKSHSLGTRPLPNFVIPGLPSNQSQSALLDNSQLALESVFYSRLVETFVTITITPTLPSPPPSKPSQPTPHITNRPNNFKTTKSSSVIKNATLVRPNGLLRHTTSSCKTPGTPPLFHSKIAQERDPFSSQKQSPLSLVLRRGAASKQSSNVEYEYVSPVHRASTNPIFIIDALPNTGFVKWADTSGHRLKLSLWGKSYGQRSNEDTTREGDQSEKRKKCFRDERGVEWRVLEEWDIDLIELTPLPDDVGAFRFFVCRVHSKFSASVDSLLSIHHSYPPILSSLHCHHQIKHFISSQAVRYCRGPLHLLLDTLQILSHKCETPKTLGVTLYLPLLSWLKNQPTR